MSGDRDTTEVGIDITKNAKDIPVPVSKVELGIPLLIGMFVLYMYTCTWIKLVCLLLLQIIM